MTDSKTPEWAMAVERAIARLQALDDYAGRPAWDSILREELDAAHSQALLSAYERGRKEGIEEAAKVATAYRAEHTQMSVDALDLGRELDLATSTKAATVSASIVDAIRQLLEVKG